MLRMAAGQIRRTGALSLAPGLVDAALASLAGFTGSLYAVRFFDAGQLGLFALFFLMFQLLAVLPTRLLLVPAQVAALDLPSPERASVLARSMPLGLVAGLTAIPFVWVVLVLAPGGERADYVAFGLTTSTMVLFSPLQDHCRFMLHMSERSFAAAAVSAAQLSIVIVALASMHVLDVPAPWIPFLSLSMANAGSLVFGLILARPRLTPSALWPGARGLLRSGMVLLPASVLARVGMVGAASIVARLASTDALGAAEAARVVAAPVLVAGMGLGQVVWPRVMGAARTGQTEELARSARLLVGAIFVVTPAYLVIFGWSHRFNVMESAVPLAFTVSGLVAFQIVVAGVSVIANLPASALLGRMDNRGLLLASAFNLAAQLAVAAITASAIGAHAVPAARLAGEAAGASIMIRRVHGLGRALRPW